MSGFILIIENEAYVREALTDILEIVGLKAINTQNGREAITAFQSLQSSIDLVIMDMRLPDMDGTQILQELEAIQPNVKVIVASGEDKQKLLRHFAAHPNVSVLQKPYDMDTMLNNVWRMIND
jgi:DNA-binding NtrC family response regulator